MIAALLETCFFAPLMTAFGAGFAVNLSSTKKEKKKLFSQS